MYLEDENILNCINDNLDILEHIHISAPYLDRLCVWKDEINYKMLFSEIKKVYNKMISIEMLNHNDLDIFRDILYLID